MPKGAQSVFGRAWQTICHAIHNKRRFRQRRLVTAKAQTGPAPKNLLDHFLDDHNCERDKECDFGRRQQCAQVPTEKFAILQFELSIFKGQIPCGIKVCPADVFGPFAVGTLLGIPITIGPARIFPNFLFKFPNFPHLFAVIHFGNSSPECGRSSSIHWPSPPSI
jgi:hypothetical protein